MTDPLFYHPGTLKPGVLIMLSDEEARHAVVTRRLLPGDELSLFDGCGNVATARIDSVSKRDRQVQLSINECWKEPQPLPVVHLASALPKGDRQGIMLDMATQLGMAEFTPLRCTHSVVNPRTHASRRWQRACLEACKQSRRAYLPKLNPVSMPLEVARCAAENEYRILIAHPDGRPLPLEAEEKLPWHRILLLIGPEGGFTDDEVRQVTAEGGMSVTLGTGTLRVETAATALVAWVMTRFAPRNH